MGNGKCSYAGVQVFEVINTRKAVNGGHRFKRTDNKLAMSGRLVKFISWNINGCGNPAKRKKVLKYLKNNQADIVLIRKLI